MARESVLQRQIIQHLRGMGAWVFNDLLVGYQGRFYAMEVKRPGNQLSPAQVKAIEAIRASGSVAGRVESIEEAVALLDE